MKILHAVEQYYPSVGGMQEVVRQLSEKLVKLGHDVTVATSYHPDRKEKENDGVKIIDFDISGNIVNGFLGDVEQYRNYLLKSNFDVITFFAAQQWSSDLAFLILDRIKAIKVFVPTGFSELYSSNYSDYFNSMKTWMKKYDMNVFLSDDYRDINFARNNFVKKRTLIPNGAAENEFLVEKNLNFRKRIGIDKDDLLIILVGSHTGVKGHKEAIEIFKRANICNSTFLVIGNFFNCRKYLLPIKQKIKRIIKKNLSLIFLKYQVNCPDLCLTIEKKNNKSISSKKYNKSIMIRLLNRPETVQAYIEADLFLFPSNIECSPIVLFECMASKTPFLTGDVGNAVEIIKWSNAGLLLPSKKNEDGYCRVDIKKSVTMFEDLCNNPQRRRKMGNNGFIVWKNKYTWEKIAIQYEKLYTDLIKKEV